MIESSFKVGLNFHKSVHCIQRPLDLKKKGPPCSNKVAPITLASTAGLYDTAFSQLPPNMISLVETFLKDIEEESLNTSTNKNDNTIIVDLAHDEEDDLPGDIRVSLWTLGGHVDLVPAFFHFLSQEAVYILTFDLCQDLSQFIERPVYDIDMNEWDYDEAIGDITNLEYLINWINLIYHRSRMKSSKEHLTNVIIVGTNRSALHPDSRMQESIANMKFEVIREALRGQAMENNVCQTYFAIDETELESNSCSCSDNDNPPRSCLPCECHICQMKIKIYHLLMRLPRMGMKIPESWVQFEQIIYHWIVDKGINFATIEEMFESYMGEGDLGTFKSLLTVYSDMGLIFMVGNLVIFATQSFTNILAQLISPFHFANLVRTVTYYISKNLKPKDSRL